MLFWNVRRSVASVRRAKAPLEREAGENPFVVVDALQECMDRNVNIVRNGPELTAALEQLQALKKRSEAVKVHPASQYNAGWNTALDLRNMLITCEAVARWRDQYPATVARLSLENARTFYGLGPVPA